MSQHGAGCLGPVGGKASPLLRRGNAMTDEGAKAGIEGTGAGAHILLFEDDDTLAGLLARVLRTEGYQVDVLDSAESMPAAAKLARYDVVLSDIHLANDTSGHDVLKRVREARPTTPVILMTAYADIEGAMNAVGEGAYDYLAKPIEPTELKRMVGEAIARRKLARGRAGAAAPRRTRRPSPRSSARRPAMLTVYKTVAHVAPTTATVLIVGESGTGKELVARAIHAKSPRAHQALRRHQLRRPARVDPRERALRPRARRVHRRERARSAASSRRPRAARSSSTRSARSARRCRCSSCACCRRARSGASARPRRSRSTCASSPRPTAI